MTFNKERFNQLQEKFNDLKLDVAYISDFKTVQYLTGFGSDPFERILAMVVFPTATPFIFAPALEEQVIKDSGWPYDVLVYQDNQDGMQMIVDEIKKRSSQTSIIGIEQANINFQRGSFLGSKLNVSRFENITPIIENTKLYKTDDEIAKLIQAGKDADMAFEVGFKALAEGKSELQVAAEIEYQVKLHNIPGMSFDTLIQFGAHAADPHGEASTVQLKKNEMALFDLGTIFQGYISDASRTVAFGTPSDHMKEVHQVTLDAQLAAMAAAKPGITAAELDKVARDVIEKAGYGQYFIHRLGHGIGMNEHEFPSIMEGNDLVLQPGMAFSIEPGIYIPGDLGVRIEDCVVITENGNIALTNTSKELLTF
jgi:Xaa-Pro dipeptidase